MECGTGFLLFCNDFHTHSSTIIQGLQLLLGRHDMKVPAQKKLRIPKSEGDLVSVLNHLDCMEDSRDSRAVSLRSDLEPIMELHVQNAFISNNNLFIHSIKHIVQNPNCFFHILSYSRLFRHLHTIHARFINFIQSFYFSNRRKWF